MTMYKYTNEKEILEALERQALLIEQRLNSGFITLDELNGVLPPTAAIVLHEMKSFTTVYLSDKSLKILNVSREEYIKNPLESIRNCVFPGSFERSAHQINSNLSKEQHHLPIAYFQRIKMYGGPNYEGFYTLSKLNNQTGNLSSIYLPIDHLTEVTPKVLRFLEESLFVKNNYRKFSSLTKRELEIITLLANGYQNNEVSDRLFISKSTVEQHRKNLKRKLEVKRFVDLVRFAQAFDLI